ncbi:hypothetical protein J5681_05195 [bacterium]|nr:hypothetical protein [bacterium]
MMVINLNIIRMLRYFFGAFVKKFALKSLFVYIPRNFVLVKGIFVMFFICALIASLLFSFNVEAKTIVIEEIQIEGTIQKPEVMTFLSRAKFSYRSLDLNVSFLEEVEKAVCVDDAF